MKVIVLGASGMLGSMVLDYLSRDTDLEIAATGRRRDLIRHLRPRLDKIDWRFLDAQTGTVKKIAEALGDAAWAVNCIGILKPFIHDDNAAEVERAVAVNALFPHRLARAAEATGCRVLQIATDCVYSGRRGQYTEKDPHDPLDVYGKTKSLGEVFSANVRHLRCSIVGQEPEGHVSLMDWFLGQPRSAGVSGYTNHQWNGVTVLQFARVCHGIIKQNLELPHVQHLIPTGSISKAELLQSFARDYRREDISINPTSASIIIDRTLATTDGPLNQQLWEAAGYARPPSVPEMVAELAKYDCRCFQEMVR